MSPALGRALTGLAGAAVMIAAVTVLSRVLGFARYLLQAELVGAGVIGTAYNSANTLPNVLFEVAAGGALAGALVPVLAAPVARSARDEIQSVVSGALGWTLLVLVPLAGLLAALSGTIAGLLAGGDADAEALVRYFILVFAIQVPMYGVAVLLYAVLQSHKRFFWPAFAPVMSSLVVIAVYVAYGSLAHGERNDPSALDPGALEVLAWGTTLGVAAMCLPMIVPVRRLGISVRPRLRFPGDTGGRLARLALAGIGAVAAQQLALVVVLFSSWGPHARTSTFTVFLYTQQVYLLPYAVLVVPLATSTFPRLAARAAGKDIAGFARMASTTTRGVLSAAVLGAAAVVAAAGAVATVFGALEKGPHVVADMTAALTWMLPGVAGFAVMFHASRALYALERGRAAVVANVAGWGSFAVAVLVLVPAGFPAGGAVVSIAAASTLGMTIGGVVAVVALRRAAGRGALDGLPRTGVVLAVGGVLAALAGRWIADTVQSLGGHGVWTALAAAAGGGLLAAVVVLAAVFGFDRGTVTGVLRVEREPVRPAAV